jgi:tripartite-type tricarboxylate transporter receptor subunit TctC
VSTTELVSLLPGVPPIATVLAGYSVTAWNVLAVPASTPRETVAKVSAEWDCILHMPDVVEKFATFGSRPIGGTPEDTSAFLKEERVRWEAGRPPSRPQRSQRDSSIDLRTMLPVSFHVTA